MCFCICIRPNDRKRLRQNRVKFPQPRPVVTETTTTPPVLAEIPRVYRILFTIIDPIFSIVGFIVHLSPSTALPLYSCNPNVPITTEIRALLDTLASFFLLLAVMQIFFLRARPHDLGVWKVLQSATLVLDVGKVLGFVRAFAGTGRLKLEGLRGLRAEEWMVFGVVGAMGVVRIVFLAGAGMKRGGKRNGWTKLK
ncbi:hypothetical protein CERZMDRAFT_83570 [Cercospora zeae-maydis SCOH1-5]|uniref:DUF7704 domain-containing protein n=1 Tax=Cercospora zeae-maydis SCOH1-5 TaxID=717836 RepID=A0A6A6FJH5_9PEZI|nr:hypothetical protein CERZMDRAFT_83570 [Cercospora zeae-maydis SCOH1-5]